MGDHFAVEWMITLPWNPHRSDPACLERAPDTQRGRRKLYTPAYPCRVRSSTNASRGLNSRHDGQPYVDSTTSVDGARTMPRHNAGSSSPQDRASTRIPISTAPSGSSGNTGPCISQTQEGDLRPRLLLASTRLSTRSTTRYQPGFLGQETRPEHPAGYRQRESAPTARVDNSRSLGVRNQAHGRAGAPHQRISRHAAIEIDRPWTSTDQARSATAAILTTSFPQDGGRSISRNARQTWEEKRFL